MNDEFKHIEHWEFVTPKEAIRYSANELKAFISNYFNTYHYQLKDQDNTSENLLFALVEVTTANINDLKGVGDTFVYSNKPKEYVDTIFSNYHQLLEEINNNEEGFLTEYQNWYKHQGFLLVSSNPESTENAVTDFMWHSVGLPSKDGAIAVKIEELDDKQILENLNTYADKVIPLLGMTNFPFSFILIKPVSLIDPLKLIRPVGNFFFHIGLREKLNEAQIVNFLNLFLLVWVKKYWSKIFERFKLKAITDIEIDENFYLHKLDNISAAARIFGKDSYDDYVKRFFKEDEQQGRKFQKELHTKIFPEIIISLYYIKVRKQKDLGNFSSYIYSVNGESFKNKGYVKSLVREFIILRLIVNAGLLLFKMHISQIVNLIRNSTLELANYMTQHESLDSVSKEDMKYYMQNSRFIYFGTADPQNRSKIVMCLISSLSPFEAYTFLTAKDQIIHLRDTDDSTRNQEILRSAIEVIDSIVAEKLESSYHNLIEDAVS